MKERKRRRICPSVCLSVTAFTRLFVLYSSLRIGFVSQSHLMYLERERQSHWPTETATETETNGVTDRPRDKGT